MKAVICANVDDPKRKFVPNSYHIAKQKDLLWMFCLYLLPDTTPMWTEWSSLLEKDNTTLQKISYLPQINMSPTSNSVVMETLKRSLKVMVETGKTSITVTYDLAIAKIALQIQHAESPQFDNIFVKFGDFYINCAYFNSVGKYINESGILALGSKKGFIKGKHYHRCKRIHPLLVAALQTLHIESLLQSVEIEDSTINLIKDELNTIQHTRSLPSDMSFLSRELQDIMVLYDRFVQDTLTGLHGATAQFWIAYIQTIHIYLEFGRSIRTSDFD